MIEVHSLDDLDTLYFVGECLEHAADLLAELSQEEASSLREQARRYKQMAGTVRSE